MSDRNLASRPETEPGTATAENGLVFLDGPAGLALTITPDAAILTGERLIAAALQARTQARSDDIEE